jgi:DNA polymerase III gamma/tau subunit
MSVLFSDAAVSARLTRVFVSGKVPHAMMIVSDQAIDVAREIAASIVCDNRTFPACGVCAHCRKNRKHIHPDVIEIVGKTTIQVDQIREMRLDALVLPNDCDRKVYIINEAQTMTEAAQNAFLKILEQPPSGVFFLLAASHRRDIIDTIRSRVVEINLQEKRTTPQTSAVVEQLFDACLKRDELQISCLIEQGFAADRAKAVAFVGEFILYLNQIALGADTRCEQALALYEVARDILSRLEKAGNVGLCAAYFSIQCLEAVF